jgi:SAM-dependent methyltransferase
MKVATNSALRNEYPDFVPELYDAIPFYGERQDIEFYISAAIKAGGPVLELACGSGRLLLGIARAGIRITGLDYSNSMLKCLREKIAREPSDTQQLIEVIQGDMTTFHLDRKFPLILVAFRSFQHLLKIEDQVACLSAIKRHLSRDGRVILDFSHTGAQSIGNVAALQESGTQAAFHLGDGRYIELKARVSAFHPATQINDIEMIYYVQYPDGRSERLVHAFPIRYLFRYEVEHLIARSGLLVLNSFGDFDHSPLGDDSPEMIFIAAKQRRTQL